MPMENFKEAKESNASLLTDKMWEIMEAINEKEMSDNFVNIQ
jgi:hypothetical protein